MKQKRRTVDPDIARWHRADVEPGKGMKAPEASKMLSITEQTYHRWRQKDRGRRPELPIGLNALQREKARLKMPVANQALDMKILREAAKGHW